MLLDEERALYKAFGLRKSVLSVWSIESMAYYAEQKCAGRTLYPMEEGDDPHQLGGDFVINKDGKMVLLHKSTHPTDRPSVNTLLDSLKSL